MRQNVKENVHLNHALMVISKTKNVFTTEGFRGNSDGGYEIVKELCEDVESYPVKCFLLYGLNLIVDAYMPEYINALLDARLLCFIHDGNVSSDEIFAMSLVRSILTSFLQLDVNDHFLDIVSGECSNDVRDIILRALPLGLE